MNLSVIIITHNESGNIQECLESVSFAQECIVLDGGSTDDTVKRASEMRAKVMTSPTWQGFGHQKNLALSYAQSDWVLSIDADERIPPALAKEIQAAIKQDHFDVFDVPRKTNFCGTWINHCGWTPDTVARLFRLGKAEFSLDKVHERLVGPGLQRLGHLRTPLLHYSYPTPLHYWKKLQTYSQAWAEQQFAKGRQTTMSRAFFAACFAFCKSYVFRLGFLDGAMGFAVCTMQAQAAFGKYFTLYYMNQNNR